MFVSTTPVSPFVHGPLLELFFLSFMSGELSVNTTLRVTGVYGRIDQGILGHIQLLRTILDQLYTVGSL